MPVRLPLIGVVLVLLLAGCSSGPGSGGSGASDPLAGAPSDWLAFVQWAEKKITETPASVPLPTPAAPSKPRWPAIRLDAPQLVAKAIQKVDWKPAAQSEAPLTEILNVRSDKPGPNLMAGIDKKAGIDGGEAVRVRIGGFRVKRENVGMIDLRIRVPFGRHFTLMWGKAGQILIPVRSTTEAFAFQIPTDGFAEWDGPLNSIDIITDGVDKKPVEVEWLRFMPRTNAYPEPAAAGRVRLNLDTRDALYMHCPGEIRYPSMKLPTNAKLQFGLGAVASGKGDELGAVVECAIDVFADGGAKTVFEGKVDSPRWSEYSVSLAEWSGKSVEIVLRSKADHPEAVMFFSAPAIYEPQENAPFVVLYLIDTLAAEHMELYGYTRQTMQRLTEMARGGVWFDAVSNASRTIESIPNLMLSMPVERHGVWQNSTLVPHQLTTLAESMREAGFATISFCTNVNAGPRQGLDQGFDHFVDRIGYYWTTTDRTIPIEEAMTWVRQHRDRPMFMYVHTAEPHAPYTPPADLEKMYDPDYTGRYDGTYEGATSFHLVRPGMTRDIQHIVALYDAEVTYADRRLGMFLDALKGDGLLEHATFWVTADHGEEFLEHGVWEHGLNLHNDQTRVPLIAFGANVASSGKAPVVAQLHDITPTLLDMLNLPRPHEMSGASLWPIARKDGVDAAGDEKLKNRQFFIANYNYRVPFGVMEYAVVEPGKWKLLHEYAPEPIISGGASSRFKLYNLAQDPTERVNLMAKEQDQARRLISELLRWRASQHPYDVKAGSVEFDATQGHELQSLGYIGTSSQQEKEPESPASMPVSKPAAEKP